MAFLPENTVLGVLSMLEVYIYYDRPVLFACRNAIGAIFLVVLDDESDDAEIWLFVGMSVSRFEHVRSGGVDLYTAFRQAEDGIVFEIRTPGDGSQAQVIQLKASEIDDDRLPVAGEVLNLPTPTLPELDPNLNQKALQAHREYLKMKLEFPDKLRTEAPAYELGKILQATQDVINELGRQLSPLYRNGRLTHGLQRMMSLAVSGLGPGSFDLELVSSRPPTLFGEILLADALEELAKIVNIGGNEQLLKDYLSKLQKNATLQYFKFLQAIRDSTADVTEVTWASPVPGREGFARITSPVVYEAIDVLNNWTETETTEIEVVVELEGLLLNAKRFEVAIGEDTVYRGTIASNIDLDVWERMRSATLSKQYKVRIRQTTTIKMSAENPTVKNILLNLEPL